MTKEQRWLPQLAPRLPLEVPTPVALGRAGSGYPWPWSVYSWLDGVPAERRRLGDGRRFGERLAGFLRALWRIETIGGAGPGVHDFGRGVPLVERDRPVRDALDALTDALDVGRARTAWQRALAAPPWRRPPVWIHDDLQPGNLLLRDGELTAVIDFGGLGLGDPACDLMVAWNRLPADARPTFRDALPLDDAAWERGRGWAPSVALIALPYYRRSRPDIADRSLVTIEEVLAD